MSMFVSLACTKINNNNNLAAHLQCLRGPLGGRGPQVGNRWYIRYILWAPWISLKERCHTFPVITHPLVCYEGFYACKRSAESKPLKGSKTRTQKRPPQNASLEISHVLPGHRDVWISSSHAQSYDAIR